MHLSVSSGYLELLLRSELRGERESQGESPRPQSVGGEEREEPVEVASAGRLLKVRSLLV